MALASATVAGDADDVDIGLAAEHPGQGAGQQLVVVDEEHADRFRVARAKRQIPSLAVPDGPERSPDRITPCPADRPRPR